MEQVIRRGYLETLEDLRDKNLIKVVTGARRVGKSTLLSQYRDALKTKTPDAPILSINFDEPEYRFLAEKGWKDVYDFVAQAIRTEKMYYVFHEKVLCVKHPSQKSVIFLKVYFLPKRLLVEIRQLFARTANLHHASIRTLNRFL
jgi:predicted AAA+ superfamily ATPase